MKNTIFLGFLTLGVAACAPTGSSQPDDNRGQAVPRDLGKADGTDSCVGHCDDMAPSGCWCDDACAQYGDCCADKSSACDAAPASCVGHCGDQAPEGCWCDDACAQYGDCCDDKALTCDAPADAADCTVPSDCTAPETCVGIPRDGSGVHGKCIDTSTSIPGVGEVCREQKPCNDGLVCAGEHIWGDGTCVPAWMRHAWEDAPGATIPDDDAAGLSRAIVAYGLATVPVDIVVDLDITHPYPKDLRVTLTDPNGVESVLVDRDAGPGMDLVGQYVVTSNPLDDSVNGRWTLQVTDLESLDEGTLNSWRLELTSRWD